MLAGTEAAPEGTTVTIPRLNVNFQSQFRDSSKCLRDCSCPCAKEITCKSRATGKALQATLSLHFDL